MTDTEAKCQYAAPPACRTAGRSIPHHAPPIFAGRSRGGSIRPASAQAGMCAPPGAPRAAPPPRGSPALPGGRLAQDAPALTVVGSPSTFSTLPASAQAGRALHRQKGPSCREPPWPAVPQVSADADRLLVGYRSVELAERPPAALRSPADGPPGSPSRQEEHSSTGRLEGGHHRRWEEEEVRLGDGRGPSRGTVDS